MADFDMADLQRRMDGAIQALGREFGGLRTGRASTSLLEPITVDAYGSQMPMNQVGNVAAPEPRLLTVQVWDQSMVKSVRRRSASPISGSTRRLRATSCVCRSPISARNGASS